MGKFVLGVVTLALSAGTASAQGYGYGYGYDNGYGYAAPVADLAPPAYGYAAPAYGYAAPAVAPAQAGPTIIIVTPGSGYSAAPVSGYYNYAPGYWGGGYGRAGYWGGYGYGWR
jgi:hypothetical protein